MRGFANPDDFEFSGSLGRCIACHGPGDTHWQKLTHLRTHEKQPRHRENAQHRSRDLQRRTQEHTQGQDNGIPSNHRRAFAATCEDVEDEGWFYMPPVIDDDHFDSPPSSVPPLPTPGRSTEQATGRDPLAPDPSFTAGDAFDDPFAISLDDVLSGMTLAALGLEDEEVPPMLGDELADDNLPFTAQEMAEAMFDAPRPSRAIEEFYPYPNKGMMKTDILFSSSRLRFSRAQQEAILAWGKDLGAREVPSLHALNKFQQQTLEAVGNPTVKWRAASGNVFYMNSIRASLARDYSHPRTRQLIHAYPEYTNGRISEVWQAAKWLKDAPDHLLTPMIRMGLQDFYINELTRCTGNTWFIPKRFFEMRGTKWASGLNVHSSEAGFVVSSVDSIRDCATFELSYPQVLASQREPVTFAADSQHYAQLMPNPDRGLAAGLRWECPPIVIFIDDVSGNSTKQWNVHYSCYMSNGGLPRSAVEKERHVQFVSTSPHASPMEIIEAVCADLAQTCGSTPIKTWDALEQCYILIRPWLLFLPGDNPMQAELCSHIGLQANMFCRCCHVGGPKAFKESDNGYVSLMKPGVPRKVEETRESILNQYIIATQPAADKHVKDAISASGVKDAFAMPIINGLVNIGKIMRRPAPGRHAFTPDEVHEHLKKEYAKRKDTTIMNPLLRMEGFDVHKDTPVEPLHTHLLGVVKYLWAQTLWVIEKGGKLPVFQMKLAAVEKPGLNIPNIMAEYMCRYRGGLIGKHFKTISQIMPFAICGLVEEDLLEAWLAIGRLTVLIWETDIPEIKTHVERLRGAIEEVLDYAAKLSPGLITMKTKFHILTHLPEHIIRFGPSILFSTERYESFNRVFRLCSIHSNRQSPSRDIATSFAHQSRCRHICTGGFWFDDQERRWVQASKSVLNHLHAHRIDAHLLGIHEVEPPKPGTMTFPSLPPGPRQERIQLTWAETSAAQLNTGPYGLPMDSGIWHSAETIVTLNGDKAQVGNEVLVHREHGEYAPLVFASIVQILAPAASGTDPAVVVRLSTLQDEPHCLLKMPVISRSGEICVLRAADIVCLVNVQHDCANAQCTQAERFLRQERETTLKSYPVVAHDNSDRFVVNTASLHNQLYLNMAIPDRLRQHAHSFEDRSGLHRSAAQSLRDKKLQKKLQQEAAVRKQAEKALAALAPNTTVLLDGPQDVEVSAEEVEVNDNNMGPLEDAEDLLQPEAIVLSNLLTLRGPRRKGG